MRFCILLPLAATALLFSAPNLQAIAYRHFEWQGDGGYSVLMCFSYHEDFAIVSDAPRRFEESVGELVLGGLRDLKITFFDEFGDNLGSYQNVENGINRYPYIQFEYDTTSNRITRLDAGEDPGYYLVLQNRALGVTHPPGAPFLLFESDGLVPNLLDRGTDYRVIPKEVPDSGASIGLLLLGLGVLRYVKRTRLNC